MGLSHGPWTLSLELDDDPAWLADMSKIVITIVCRLLVANNWNHDKAKVWQTSEFKGLKALSRLRKPAPIEGWQEALQNNHESQQV